LYQLVKRHQKQAAGAEETPDQLNQVCSPSVCLYLSLYCSIISLVCQGLNAGWYYLPVVLAALRTVLPSPRNVASVVCGLSDIMSV